MLDIQQELQTRVTGFASIGHPALLERFTLGRGKVYSPDKLRMWPAEDRMTPKQCYQNAAELTLRDDSLRYVEGYALNTDFALPFEHAWVEYPDGTFADPTLPDPQNYQYMGVSWSPEELWEEMERTGVYGLYDTGTVINTSFVLRHMPGLRDEVREACGCVLP